jgi:uncharacterized protein (DUF2236 family)
MGNDDELNGYFPRGRSILRRVHGERAVGLMYGQRALMIGALNPLSFVGTIAHTYARKTPFQRLAHTGMAFETIFFGARREADEVLARVARLHERVRGELPEDAGEFAAGTPYSAFDPELMLWTLAVIADSAETFYELLVRRLTTREREALWRDYVRFGELFGLPRDAAPASYREFRNYWRDRMASDELHVTPEAREVGYATAFEIPVPGVYGPLFRVHDLLMLGSLPPRVRELYGLAWTPAQQLAFDAAASAARASRPLVPKRFRRGPNRESFELVARTERGRVSRGDPTPQVAERPL